MSFNIEEKHALLILARESILHKLENKKNNIFNRKEKIFLQCAGAFVTLHTKEGDLRGCIGNMVSDEPLYKTIIEMSRAAAFNDPRFAPITLTELKDIIIEISVLSPLEKVKHISEIKLGKHGVLVRKGSFSGVFLPQVAVETGWSLDEFMNNLCVEKAGLPENAWKDKNIDIYIFTVEIMSE
jgi:AmmeMemoRadiSam system protein A